MSTDARITLYGDSTMPEDGGGLAAAFVGRRPSRVTLVDVSIDSTDPVADVAFAAAKMARHAAYGPPEPQILNLPDSPAVIYVTGGDLTINGNLTSHAGTFDKPEEGPTPESEGFEPWEPDPDLTDTEREADKNAAEARRTEGDDF